MIFFHTTIVTAIPTDDSVQLIEGFSTIPDITTVLLRRVEIYSLW